MSIPRRKLLAGAGLGALGLAGQANAATPFTTFAFTATGEPTARTMPDRLAEIKNVKDFGAVGDGVTADDAAVQAAINSSSGPNFGTIYFPPGSYKFNNPVTFNYNGGINIRFLGEGSSSIITGGPGGYMFDRHNVNSGSPLYSQTSVVFEKLSFLIGVSTTGSIRVGSCDGVTIRDCVLQGQTGVTTEDSAGNSSQNVTVMACSFSGPSAVPYNTQNGIVIGGSGFISGCDFVNCYVAIRAYGNGLHICGCRAENSQVGYQFGLDSNETDQNAHGFSLSSFTCEGDDTGVYLAGTCSGFYIGPGNILGHTASNSGYPTNVQDSSYGLRLSANCSSGWVGSVAAGSVARIGCIDIATASARANVVFSVVSGNQVGGAGVSWSLQYGSPTPTNAYTVFFDRCNIDPIWTYSQLPQTTNVIEGDEFGISDSTTNTWGANVTVGSGANHVLVRYNGSNYTVVAK